LLIFCVDIVKCIEQVRAEHKAVFGAEFNPFPSHVARMQVHFKQSWWSAPAVSPFVRNKRTVLTSSDRDLQAYRWLR
jgi:hypothetical protein